MDELPDTSAPSQRYQGQIAQALARLEKIVVDGLQHGFFDCSIECEMGNGRIRHLVIRAGNSYKYTIREDELPR
jgi:hypothetical protein